MTKKEVAAVAEEVKKNLINDEGFCTEIAQRILALPCKDLGLQAPGSLLEFFREDWSVEAGCNT